MTSTLHRDTADLWRRCARRWPGIAEFVKFCFVGSLGVLADLATVVVLREVFGLDHRLCAVGGFQVAVTQNYLLNRRWTFRNARQAPWLRSYVAYVLGCGVGLLVRVGTVHGLTQYTLLGTGRWYILANFLGIVGGTAVNYTGAKVVAFRTRGAATPAGE
jgi:dolichol-phosphate mannosyltransferase